MARDWYFHGLPRNYNNFPPQNSRPEHSWLPEANDRPVPKQESWGDDSHSTGIITIDLPSFWSVYILITLLLFQYPLYSASLAEYNMEQVRTSKTINKWSKHRQTMPLSRWVTTLLRREVGHWTLLSLRGLIKLQRWGDTSTLARVLQHCNLRPISDRNMAYISSPFRTSVTSKPLLWSILAIQQDRWELRTYFWICYILLIRF